MSRRVLPAIYTILGRLRHDLAAEGLGPTTLRGIAANPGMPVSDATLLEELAHLAERIDHIYLAEALAGGGVPVYEPTAASPARLAGDRHGRPCA